MTITRAFRTLWKTSVLVFGFLWTQLPSSTAKGAITREWWLGISGGTVADLTNHPRYPDSPDGSELLDLFEGPTHWDDDYGSRLYGWLVPPDSGEYTFWIASDDCSELWLSTDEDSDSAQLIAFVDGWTNTHEWTKYASQKSHAIPLQARQKYYIEAVMKEASGGDNISVAWQSTSFNFEVIPGEYVDTFGCLPAIASSPSPPNGALGTSEAMVLSWFPGIHAAQHQVFFGEDEAVVTGADTSTAEVYRGQQAETTYRPDSLEWGKTYYWRIDEVNDLHPDSPWRGEVWTFSLPSGPPGYLLITSEELAPAFQVLVDWRAGEGLLGELVTLQHIYGHYGGKDEQEQIRNCIRDYYEHRGTVYVTLGGDDQVVPDRDCRVWDCFDMPTDLYYGGLDGTWDEDGDGVYGEAEEDGADLYPEVWVGRIPVRTIAEATAYVNKVIAYETASPDGYANTMLFAGDTGPAFRSGSERPAGYLDHDPVSGDEIAVTTLYRDHVQPYWQPTPADMLLDTKTSWDTVRCGDYDFNPEHLGQRLNWGYHHVYIRTHGNAGYCGSENGRFYVTDALALTNVDRPSIVYCEGCGTGAFDVGEPSLSEAFLRNPHGGAVAFIGCSRTNFFAHADRFYRELFVNKRERIGEAFGYYKMSWAPDSTTNKWTRAVQFGRNLQGDSALRFLSEETARDVRLSSPHGCEIIAVGSDLTIRWNASGTDFESTEKVKLEYSADSGVTWNAVPGAEGCRYNERIFTWRNCPLLAGSHYRIKVTSLADPSVNDMSSMDFTIADLCLLTVRSIPDANIVITGSYDDTTSVRLVADYDITIPKGTTVSVEAPWGPDDMPELAFKRWKDESGNTLSDMPGCTFSLSNDMTIVVEYSEPVGRFLYVNDTIPENGVAAGDDSNDGLTPDRPMRSIQALLDKYPELGVSSIINVSPGLYEENIAFTSANSGLELRGAGSEVCIVDGGRGGSCISVSDFRSGVVSGLTIRNGSSVQGGGILCSRSALSIHNCTFIANAADSAGGAILVDSSSNAAISDCVFVRNSGFSGGAIYNYGTAEIVSCLFEDNSAIRFGGAVHVYSGNHLTQIYDCTFSANTTAEQGGAVFLDRSTSARVFRCVFRGNSAINHGGALCNFGGTAEIESCLFETNHANRDGGAVCNRHDCAPTFLHCVFNSNDGRFGGAIITMADQSHATIQNCTFSGNHARNSGGALCCQGSLGATATNSIFWANTPDQIDGGVSVTYSDIQDGWPDQGNIDADPLFADSSTGDFHLKSQAGRWSPGGRFAWTEDLVTSPCIDAGDPGSPGGDEPEPNGDRINMGAYGGTAEASKSP